MAAPRKALVLGGGGITGIAWELGVIAGLSDAGVEVASADVVVGTSAGSVVGAQILSGVSLETLYAEQVREPTGDRADRMGGAALARFVIAALWPGDGRRGRAYLGHAALRARTISETEWRHVFESTLHGRDWPDTRLVIPAVDAESGEPRIFDRDSGVGLVTAVSASCAVPLVYPPVSIDGRRYIDGGARSIVNADLATGCDRVVVIAPVTIAFRRRHSIATQLARLGPEIRTAVVGPDAAARRAIGRNVLDPARRADAARAGRTQGAAIAETIRGIWSNPT